MFINTGLKEKKNIPKSVTVIKDDCQAFGLVGNGFVRSISISHNLCSTDIDTPDSQLRSGPKYLLRNLLINESKAETNISPEGAIWIYDGMPLMRTLKPAKTYEDWFQIFLT